jgi:hypothetical protein
MKSILWIIYGACTAALGFLAWNSGRTPPFELLAHRLETAWADHHTIVETV